MMQVAAVEELVHDLGYDRTQVAELRLVLLFIHVDKLVEMAVQALP